MRLMLSILAMITVALVIAWMLGFCRSTREPVGQVTSGQSGPTVEQIQALAQLVTERVNVSDVIETKLAGRFGSISALVVVKGNLLISTNLSLAHFESVDDSSRCVVLMLPQPAILQAALDQEQTRVFAVSESGLWRITPSDNATAAAVTDLAYRDAQRFVGDAIKDPAVLARAREHTEQVLAEFLRAGKWQLVVKWIA